MIKKGDIITIFGGTGFLGGYIISKLAKTGALIKVVSRDTSKALHLKSAGFVGQISLIDGNAISEKEVDKAVAGSKYVINLLGILFSKSKQSFENVHVKAAKNIAYACKNNNVKKLIHISALGCERVPSSKYATTKYAGEKMVRDHFPKATILKPSVVFGPEDNFLNFFNKIAKMSPIMPLFGGGKTKFQPVYVGDVADAVMKILESSDNCFDGKSYELVGPEVYSFKEILAFILQTTKRKRLLVSVPFFVAKIKAFFLSLAPKPLLTPDQVELLKYDNVSSTKSVGFKDLGIEPKSMTAIAPSYLR